VRQIVLTPDRSWRSFLKAAVAEIYSRGGIVLVATTPSTHVLLLEIHREFRFPRRHTPEAPAETWPIPADEINPRIFIDRATRAWHLLLARPDVPLPPMTEHGVPRTTHSSWPSA
jgi:hypothetical protein